MRVEDTIEIATLQPSSICLTVRVIDAQLKMPWKAKLLFHPEHSRCSCPAMHASGVQFSNRLIPFPEPMTQSGYLEFVTSVIELFTVNAVYFFFVASTKKRLASNNFDLSH